MNYKHEIIYYPYTNLEGRSKVMKVNYTLWFDGAQLIEVRNEYNVCVETKSECWLWFNSKYNI